MNERVKKLYDRLLKREYRAARSEKEHDFSAKFAAFGLDDPMRSALRLKRMLEAETPVVLPEERIGFLRTVKHVPGIFTAEEWKKINEEHFVFDFAIVGNINPNYEDTIRAGFAARIEEVTKQKIKFESAENTEGARLMESMLTALSASLEFVERYRKAAEQAGNAALADVLKRVPREGAKTFYEALVFFRILNYLLWINGNKHNTIGRFDQYIYPYFLRDLDEKTLTEEQAKDLLEELFISLNMDADLYPGVQQGDNGQSMVLGGCTKDGKSAYNKLSELCLRASLELKLIDPKINLRVNQDTPQAIYELGTELTKQGLGFPQYNNDDVVIPGLVALGYTEEDARDYVVAACWEFIIPGKGMDIPNIEGVNFPRIVNDAIIKYIKECKDFPALLAKVREEIREDIAKLLPRFARIFVEPSPFMSLFMQDCVKNGKDVSKGCIYNNYGLHGVGIANATDALSAVKKLVYEDNAIAKDELLAALQNDFNGYLQIQNKLKNDAPKMGNNDDFADDIAKCILEYFHEALAGKKNERGGIYRAGTGTAMYYIWYSTSLPATADGRNAKEAFSANFSPSLNCRLNGPLSVIQSFAKPDMKKFINGGPLTLEIHDTAFRNEDGIQKVAMLVKSFIGLGGHQLQLNAINRDTLLDAKAHPEKYPNLIVRVWGWSGYFNELDPEYQDHVIKRAEFTF